MRRREFITLLGGAAAAWPLAARAQQPRARCGASACSWPRPRTIRNHRPASRRSCRAGSNWAGPTAATCGSTRAGPRPMPTTFADTRRNWSRSRRTSSWRTGTATVAPLLQATRTVPIVFVIVIDPVGAGFVDSLARPGGNATGFLMFEYGLSGKWLELLKQIAPGVTRAAVLRDPAIASGIGQFAAIQAVAPSFGVELSPVNVRDAGEIERAVTAFARSPNGGLIVTASALAVRSSRSDHHAGGPAQAARGLLRPLLRHRRRPDLLWARFDRPVPARGRLCRSHPQGREASRPAGAGADQVRAGDQPQDRQGARPRRAAVAARARRRGDRITRALLLHVRRSAMWPLADLRCRVRISGRYWGGSGHRQVAADASVAMTPPDMGGRELLQRNCPYCPFRQR